MNSKLQVATSQVPGNYFAGDGYLARSGITAYEFGPKWRLGGSL